MKGVSGLFGSMKFLTDGIGALLNYVDPITPAEEQFFALGFSIGSRCIRVIPSCPEAGGHLFLYREEATAHQVSIILLVVGIPAKIRVVARIIDLVPGFVLSCAKRRPIATPRAKNRRSRGVLRGICTWVEPPTYPTTT